MDETKTQTASLLEQLPGTLPVGSPKPWKPLLVPRKEIENEISRLCDDSREPGELRATQIVHPQSRGEIEGVSPSLSLSIIVVRPGETLSLRRDNASRTEFCIRGSGAAIIGGRRLAFNKFDTWTVPSMCRREYRCEGTEPFVWLSYSNAPMLERLKIYYSDELDAAPRSAKSQDVGSTNQYIRQNAPDYPIGTDGARLRGYEYVVDIEPVENRPLIWPWQDVLPHLSRVEGDGKRTIMLLYNPATGRINGTTKSFFATLTSFPAGKGYPAPPRGHKHSSYACNYHFEGSGHSIVDGEYIDWTAGDFLFSAPSWSEHSHGISKEGASVLTIQDHPFQIGVESLIWQEEVDGPILTLGSEPGQIGYVGPRLAGD